MDIGGTSLFAGNLASDMADLRAILHYLLFGIGFFSVYYSLILAIRSGDQREQVGLARKSVALFFIGALLMIAVPVILPSIAEGIPWMFGIRIF